MATPTQKRQKAEQKANAAWADFSQKCFGLGLSRLNDEDLEGLVSNSGIIETQVFGTDFLPDQVQVRVERLKESIAELKSDYIRSSKASDSLGTVLQGIMGLTTQMAERNYCTAAAVSFLEVVPHLLSEREFGGADHGVEQLPVYSLDTVLKAAQTEVRLFPTALTFSEADVLEISQRLVNSFSLERYEGPVMPDSPKSLEAIGLAGSFGETVFAAKLAERQEKFEQRKRARTRTGILTATLFALASGEVYYTVGQGYHGEDFGDAVADIVYGPLPESPLPQTTKPKAATKPAAAGEETLGVYVPPSSGDEVGGHSVDGPDGDYCTPCPRNLQRESFNRAASVIKEVKGRGWATDYGQLQQVIDDFRAGLTSDYVVKSAAAVAGLMFGPKSSYSPAESEKYGRIVDSLSGGVAKGKIHLYTPGREQDIGRLLLQPKPSNAGGK